MLAALKSALLASVLLLSVTLMSINALAYTHFNPSQSSPFSNKNLQQIKSGNSFSIDNLGNPDKKNSYQQLNLSHKRESQYLNVETHFEANYLNDDDSLLTEDAIINVKSLYMSLSNPRYGLSSQIGRQQFDMAGHSYAVDGLSINSSLLGRHRLKMLAGYPYQDPAIIEVETDNMVYGLSAEFAKFAKYFEADAYAYQVQQNEQTQKHIYGSRVRYLNDKQSALLQVDFDPTEQAAHSSHLVIEMKPFEKQTMKLSLDYRSPSSQSQLVISALDELQKSFDESERERLRRETDAVYRSGALSWMHKFSTDIALNSELSIATLDRSELIESDQENALYLYGMQLTRKNSLLPNDTLSMAIKYSEFAGAERVSFSLNNHLPFHRYWYADLNLDAYWENNEEMISSRVISPKLIVNFQHKDNSKLGFELGYLHLDDNDVSTREGDIFFKVTQSLFIW